MNTSTTNKVSDTPRTKEASVDKGGMTFVWVEFAEQLERELAASKAELERIYNGMQGSCYCCEPVGEMNQQLEAEVVVYKKLAIELLKELITHCDDPLHKEQLAKLEKSKGEI